MQSPFKQIANTKKSIDPEKDLADTNLLFDFLGVFIWLATSTLLIVYAIRIGLWLKSEGLGIISKNFSGPFSIFYYGRRWRFGGRGGRLFEFVQAVTALWTGAGLCVTLLVIFFFGMLKGGQQAWDKAKGLFVAYIVGSALLFVCYACVYRFLYSKRLQGR